MGQKNHVLDPEYVEHFLLYFHHNKYIRASDLQSTRYFLLLKYLSDHRGQWIWNETLTGLWTHMLFCFAFVTVNLSEISFDDSSVTRLMCSPSPWIFQGEVFGQQSDSSSIVTYDSSLCICLSQIFHTEFTAYNFCVSDGRHKWTIRVRFQSPLPFFESRA